MVTTGTALIGKLFSSWFHLVLFGQAVNLITVPGAGQNYVLLQNEIEPDASLLNLD